MKYAKLIKLYQATILICYRKTDQIVLTWFHNNVKILVSNELISITDLVNFQIS